MVRFSNGAVEPIKADFFDPANSIHFLSSAELAERLHQEFGMKKCKSHPDFESEVSVDLSEVTRRFVITKVCCEAFKAKLNLLNENLHPFGEDL